MAQELSHRGEELKGLGWNGPDVARYVELWEYRQRWGAMNLEREDRLFLRKAENALPAILSGRAATKKPIKDKPITAGCASTWRPCSRRKRRWGWPKEKSVPGR